MVQCAQLVCGDEYDGKSEVFGEVRDEIGSGDRNFPTTRALNEDGIVFFRKRAVGCDEVGGFDGFVLQ